MGDERRTALRVPVHGVAICYADDRAVRGTIENLSASGALVSFAGAPASAALDLELKLGNASGRITARAVRVEPRPDGGRRTRVALRFDQVDARVRAAIESAIDHAVASASRRPVLVLDDDPARRSGLLARLTRKGMTPLAPRTPLDAIDLLTNAQLAVSVCLLAPSFGHSLEALHHLVSDSFPWVKAAEISDDLDETVARAQDAWSGTDIARLAGAIA